MTLQSKLMSMRDAIARHVPSGSMVLLGAQLEQMIPFAAGHELIRQGRRDLTLVGPISDILFDQMIGAGCVSRVMAAWVGNVSAGVGYCFRRAVERSVPRRMEVVDYSNFTMAHGAACGGAGCAVLADLLDAGQRSAEEERQFARVLVARERRKAGGGARAAAGRGHFARAARGRAGQCAHLGQPGRRRGWRARGAENNCSRGRNRRAGSDRLRPESHAGAGFSGRRRGT